MIKINSAIASSFVTENDSHAHPSSRRASNDCVEPRKTTFLKSNGSAIRQLLSALIGQQSPLEKTKLLQTYQYKSGMVLPPNYEIVSHLHEEDGNILEFKVVGKRKDGDSSRFEAKNPETNETLCILKRTPTNEGEAVWMHPEISGVKGGTSADKAYALSFSDMQGDYEKRSFSATVKDGKIIPSGSYNVKNGAFLFGVDMKGELHLVDDGFNSDYCHTNLLGLSSSGSPRKGVCFGEIKTDADAKINLINNRSGHTLPSPEHLKYALTLPSLVQISSSALVQCYDGQNEFGDAQIKEYSVSEFQDERN